MFYEYVRLYLGENCRRLKVPSHVLLVHCVYVNVSWCLIKFSNSCKLYVLQRF